MLLLLGAAGLLQFLLIQAFNRVVTAVLHWPGFYCVQKELRKSSWSPQSPTPRKQALDGWMREPVALPGWLEILSVWVVACIHGWRAVQ